MAKRNDLVLDSYTNGLLYLQLETELKQKMLTGEYAVGERIPTEPELCDEYGVSRITVRRAVQDLVDEGLLRKVRGRGTFVAVPKYVASIGTDMGYGFGELQSPGSMEKSYEVVEAREVPATGSVCERLGLAEGEAAYYVRRVILEGEVPLAIDDLFVSAARFPGLLDLIDERTPFYELVRGHYGLDLGPEDFTLDASTARNDEARLLKCAVGAPLFILRKLVTTPDGEPIHYSKSVIRADRVSYHFRVSRDGRVGETGAQFMLPDPTPVESVPGISVDARTVVPGADAPSAGEGVGAAAGA